MVGRRDEIRIDMSGEGVRSIISSVTDVVSTASAATTAATAAIVVASSQGRTAKGTTRVRGAAFGRFDVFAGQGRGRVLDATEEHGFMDMG